MFHENLKGNSWSAVEKLDDGHKIKVKINKIDRELIFDFTGSSAVHSGNLNATEAIINSAIIYVLRIMVDKNIPLNEGIMRHVKIIMDENSFLNPRFEENPSNNPAVVGGNTEVSQRVVDTLIKAFGISACSQGTMNNVIFGNEHFGFYETIGGGTGAGEGYSGSDAVHHHMTNTKITDPEILEHNYPVRLDEMSIRHGSGGNGKWPGGNGIIRKLTFLDAVDLSLLTQHREVSPFGINGGDEGKPGKQYVIRNDGTKENLRGVDGIKMTPGDSLVIETPGGGGWGKSES